MLGCVRDFRGGGGSGGTTVKDVNKLDGWAAGIIMLRLWGFGWRRERTSERAGLEEGSGGNAAAVPKYTG